MRRLAILLAATTALAVLGDTARAQGLVGPIVIGPQPQMRPLIARDRGPGSWRRHRHHHHHHVPPPIIFLPAPTRSSLDPFGGNPQGGNYFYWLSREYAAGRVPKAEYNRQVYGIGR
jgi:hypothetical protein